MLRRELSSIAGGKGDKHLAGVYNLLGLIQTSLRLYRAAVKSFETANALEATTTATTPAAKYEKSIVQLNFAYALELTHQHERALKVINDVLSTGELSQKLLLQLQLEMGLCRVNYQSKNVSQCIKYVYGIDIDMKNNELSKVIGAWKRSKS